jgi:DNA helicase-2/ATP-dependent DNA helicase PcrA
MTDGEAELEEERRLLYVATTRARDHLHITYPLRYYHRKHVFGDSHSFAQLSRFLSPELFPLFERSGCDRVHPEVLLESGPAVPVTESVRARLDRLWS